MLKRQSQTQLPSDRFLMLNGVEYKGTKHTGCDTYFFAQNVNDDTIKIKLRHMVNSLSKLMIALL